MAPTDRRSYAQYCGTARALDVLGERWTLLIVRDLLPGPRRYGELAARLPGIATDILTKRLRTLEEHGLVAREEEAGVGRPVSYRLTADGQELRPVIEQLAAIGARWLGEPDPDRERLDLGWALGSAASGLQASTVPAVPLVISSPAQDYVLEPTDDRVVLRYLEGAVAGAVVVTGEPDALLATFSGRLSATDARVELGGDADVVAAWVAAIGAALPAPVRGPTP